LDGGGSGQIQEPYPKRQTNSGTQLEVDRESRRDSDGDPRSVAVAFSQENVDLQVRGGKFKDLQPVREQLKELPGLWIITAGLRY
jgi:hypothetical protein